MASFNEQRFMVVGGTGNVGRHIVQALLSVGATVVVPSRDARKLDALEQFGVPGYSGRLVPMLGDMSDPHDAQGLLQEAGPLDGAAASLGGFVRAPSVLAAPRADLEAVLENYLFAHLAAARAILPGLVERGGGYVMINGPLAFAPMMPGSGLVSIATAAQAMLSRVLMSETAGTPARVNELVIYSSFGWGSEDSNVVTGADIGRYVAYLISEEGTGTSGESIHLRSTDLIQSASL
jgi:NAD(P)-dependent dehydrogenase (short-subunit alcohol dehydrogenase family)